MEKRIELKEVVTTEKLLNTFVVGNATEDFVENVTKHRAFDEANYRLALGGIIAEEIRADVYRVTGNNSKTVLTIPSYSIFPYFRL